MGTDGHAAEAAPEAIVISPVVSTVSPATVPVRDGSSLYYALWGLDDATRERTLARLAVGDALSRATLDVSQPDVAHRKIHWWHEELDRLHAGNPRHPATRACPELSGSDLARSAGLDALGGAAEERLRPSATVDAQDERLAREALGRLALALDGLDAGLLDGAAGSADGVSRALGERWRALALGLVLHERLATLAAQLSRGHPVFATELYERHGARPEDLGSNDPERARRANAVIDDAVAHARDTLLAGIATVSPTVPRRRPARAPLTLARLRVRQLDLWRDRRPDLVRVRPSATPIAKLWLAWRTR